MTSSIEINFLQTKLFEAEKYIAILEKRLGEKDYPTALAVAAVRSDLLNHFAKKFEEIKVERGKSICDEAVDFLERHRNIEIEWDADMRQWQCCIWNDILTTGKTWVGTVLAARDLIRRARMR